MVGKRKFLRLEISVVAVFLSVLVVFLLSIVAIMMFSEGIEDGDAIPLEEYRYLRINTKTNETLVGFTTLPEFRDGQTYRFDNSKEESGILSLISTFGGDQYKCSGTCSCRSTNDDFKKRRRSLSSIISKSVVFLVVALTSYEAVALAKDHFNEDCERRMYDLGCEVNSVVSEVGECKILLASTDEGNGVLKPYLCKSNCVISYAYFNSLSLALMLEEVPEELYEEFAEKAKEVYDRKSKDPLISGLERIPSKVPIKFVIENLRSWAVEILDVMNRRQKACQNLRLELQVSATSVSNAEKIFAEKHLNPYCFDSSPGSMKNRELVLKEAITGSILYFIMTQLYSDMQDIPDLSKSAESYCEGHVEEYVPTRGLIAILRTEWEERINPKSEKFKKLYTEGIIPMMTCIQTEHTMFRRKRNEHDEWMYKKTLRDG